MGRGCRRRGRRPGREGGRDPARGRRDGAGAAGGGEADAHADGGTQGAQRPRGAGPAHAVGCRTHRRGGRSRRAHGGGGRSGGAGEGEREDPRPAEHGGEGDDLEEGEVDGRRDEQPGAGEQEDEDEGGGQTEATRQTVQQDRRGDEQRSEAEHHHPGDLVVQVFVGVEGDAADEGQVHADDGEAEPGDRGGTPTARPSAQATQVAAHAHGVDGHEHAPDLERRVEQGPRDIVEGPELAEVQLPPERVGRGDDRRQNPAHEHDQDQGGQVHRRQRVRASRQSLRGGDRVPRGRERGGGGNGSADRDAHCGLLSLGADRKSPSIARPSAPVGLIG